MRSPKFNPYELPRITLSDVLKNPDVVKPADWERGWGAVSYNAAYGDKPYKARSGQKVKNKKGELTYPCRYFATESQAWEFLRGQNKPDITTITTGHLLDLWLESGAVKNLAPMTRSTYRYCTEHYLRPEFGGVLVKSLTHTHVQRWLDKVTLVNDRKRRPTAGTLHKILQTLNRSLNWGKVEGLVEKNPIEDRVKLAAPPTDNFDTLTVAQAKQLLAALDKEPVTINAYFRMLLGTSLRRGEGRSLMFSDISEDGEWVRLHGQIQEHHGQTYREMKNKQHRMIAIPADVRALLPRIPRVAGSPYIFTTSNGTPLRDKQIRNDIKRIAQSIGLPSTFSTHDLRHTHATLLAEQGATTAEISDALGVTSRIAERYVKRGARNLRIRDRQSRLFA